MYSLCLLCIFFLCHCPCLSATAESASVFSGCTLCISACDGRQTWPIYQELRLSSLLSLCCTFVCISILPLPSVSLSHLPSTLLKRLLYVCIWDPVLGFHLHIIVPTGWRSNVFVKVLLKGPSLGPSHSKTRQFLLRQTCTSFCPFFHSKTQS